MLTFGFSRRATHAGPVKGLFFSRIMKGIDGGGVLTFVPMVKIKALFEHGIL